jgi:hypothetical protein
MESGIWNLGILESWNPGILESWNLGILESYHIIAKYVIIKMILFSTYATYCSACDNLIFGELAEADIYIYCLYFLFYCLYFLFYCFV